MSQIHLETHDQFSQNDMRSTGNVKPEVLARRAPQTREKKEYFAPLQIFSFAQLRATTFENETLETLKKPRIKINLKKF